MLKPTHHRTPLRLGALLPAALGLALGVGLACDLGGEEGPCDVMCNEGPLGGVEEDATNGSLTCSCETNTPSQAACETYCEEVGGSADNATLDGSSCVCTELE